MSSLAAREQILSTCISTVGAAIAHKRLRNPRCWEETLSPADERLGIDRIRKDYQNALRAWHVAWIERVEWHSRRLSPIRERVQSLSARSPRQRRPLAPSRPA